MRPPAPPPPRRPGWPLEVGVDALCVQLAHQRRCSVHFAIHRDHHRHPRGVHGLVHVFDPATNMGEQLAPPSRLLSAAEFVAAGLLLLRLGKYGPMHRELRPVERAIQRTIDITTSYELVNDSGTSPTTSRRRIPVPARQAGRMRGPKSAPDRRLRQENSSISSEEFGKIRAVTLS